MTKLLKFSRARETARNHDKPDRRFRLTKILVPVDFSGGAKDALLYASAFARHFGASLTLLHVIKPVCEIDFGYGSVVQRCQSQAEVDHFKAKLKALGKRWGRLRCKPRTLVRIGTAENEIVTTARQLEMDLIIMGTRSAWPGAGTPTRSTAEQVLSCAPCPVLILRNKEPTCVNRRKSRRLCLQKST
jgi:nucleotide-binding universal stress UspA family protein